MKVNGIEYNLVMTSANDFEHLSLECTNEQGLLLEAELVSYTDRKAKIHFHKSPLPYELIEAFIHKVKQELKYGSNKRGS
ncbi:hypothetical protein MHM93_00075 [Pseudoalteromonas sp. MM17-2]|uniref:hypothetical protein n=1 Tax=Pseudoalteromonas sp. MM17-2 TaxID=2917753 RepID=UPI001EF427DA|nr:hypothetical protein [Pseudoalteromonas sp. MM17-2]MCG7542575.1 hypothetical protein [Pseudoalteromonas sp. MM17-2]